MHTEKDLKFIDDKNKIYNFIWFFLIIEITAFFIIAYFVLVPEIPDTTIKPVTDFNTIFLYISYIGVILSVPAAYKIYDIKRKQAQKENSLKKKADLYLKTIIIIFTILEFAAILTLVAFYINKMNEPLYMFGIVYIALLLNKPSFKRFIRIKKDDEPEHVIIEENKYKENNSGKKYFS